MRRTLIPLAVLVLCGIGVAEAKPPTGGMSSIRAERVVMQLEPGKVAKARSTMHFTQSDTVGFTAYANGRELYDVNAGGSRLDLAGYGAYVVVNVIRNGPMALKAVGMRPMRLVVYMEWSAR